MIRKSPRAAFVDTMLIIVSLSFKLTVWCVPVWLMNVQSGKILRTVIPILTLTQMTRFYK